jgi:thiol-disulfide isomerase/thioredoxin
MPFEDFLTTISLLQLRFLCYNEVMNQNLLWLALAVIGAYYLTRKPTSGSLGELAGTGARIKYFSADWCPACNQYTPKFNQWAAKNNITIDKLKVQDWNDSIAKRYNINSLPYTLLDGKPVVPNDLLKMKF